MVLCENSFFEKKKNLIELDIIKTRFDGAIGIKLFLTFFHPQIEADALGFAHTVYIRLALKGLSSLLKYILNFG